MCNLLRSFQFCNINCADFFLFPARIIPTTGLLVRLVAAADFPKVLNVHILVTTDTLSGVWTYTRELVTGLVSRGLRVTLVSLGEIPLPDQTSWMDHPHGLDYHPTAF